MTGCGTEAEIMTPECITTFIKIPADQTNSELEAVVLKNFKHGLLRRYVDGKLYLLQGKERAEGGKYVLISTNPSKLHCDSCTRKKIRCIESKDPTGACINCIFQRLKCTRTGCAYDEPQTYGLRPLRAIGFKAAEPGERPPPNPAKTAAPPAEVTCIRGGYCQAQGRGKQLRLWVHGDDADVVCCATAICPYLVLSFLHAKQPTSEPSPQSMAAWPTRLQVNAEIRRIKDGLPTNCWFGLKPIAGAAAAGAPPAAAEVAGGGAPPAAAAVQQGGGSSSEEEDSSDDEPRL